MALSFIPFAFPGAPGVRCAFQTRDWGVSEGPYGGGNIAYTVAVSYTHLAMSSPR